MAVLCICKDLKKGYWPMDEVSKDVTRDKDMNRRSRQPAKETKSCGQHVYSSRPTLIL